MTPPTPSYSSSEDIIYPVIVDRIYPELVDLFNTDLHIRVGGKIEESAIARLRENWGKRFFILINTSQKCIDLTLDNLPRIDCLCWDTDQKEYFFMPLLCPAYTKDRDTKDILERNFYEYTDDIKELRKLL